MIGPLDLGPLVVYTAHARDVASQDREAFAAAVAPLANDRGALLLHTCHRVELYVWLPAFGARPVPPLPAGGRRIDGEDAARHLFTVGAGLDSVVIGEDQILHQLRDCLEARHDESAARADSCPAGGAAAAIDDAFAGHGHGPADLDPVLERLFQQALHVGRQAHAWREGTPRSLADIALDRIARETQSVDGRSILVVGAGQMGRLAAQTVTRRRARALVTNRTEDRAEAVAREVGGMAVPFAKLFAESAALPEVDGVVVAVAGTWPADPATERWLADGGATVVDLSSPSAIPAGLQASLGERFVSVDDLARGPEAGNHERLRRRVGRLVDDSTDEILRWLRTRTSVPAIRAISERAEARRASEIERLLRRLPALEPDHRELVEQMTQRLVAGILHAPLAALRDDTDGERERVARDLFGL